MHTSRRVAALGSGVFARNDVRKQVYRDRAQLAGASDLIDLSLGSSDLRPPPAVIRAMSEAIPAASSSAYCLNAATAPFREGVADWCFRRFGVTVDPDHEVQLLVGSQEGTAHLPLAVLNPGDSALVLDPCYPSHRGGLLLADADVISIRLRASRGWRPPLDELAASVWDRLKLFVFGYPHNPTARVGDQELLNQVMHLGGRHQVVIAHDNPYVDLALEGQAPSLLLSPGWRDWGIEFFSLSKGWCLGGFRLAFAVGAAPLIAALRQVKSIVDFNQSLALQQAAITALRDHADWPATLAIPIASVAMRCALAWLIAAGRFPNPTWLFTFGCHALRWRRSRAEMSVAPRSCCNAVVWRLLLARDSVRAARAGCGWPWSSRSPSWNVPSLVWLMPLMRWPEPVRAGGRLAAQYRQLVGPRAMPWAFRCVPVCSSTESLLRRWLVESPRVEQPRAVLAGHQIRAFGQRGRVWSAPRGGVWVSAALPWSSRPPAEAGLLGLAVALAMAERLEQHDLPVRIKWPNDLLVDGFKLAGLLPRLVHRGSELRTVRLGFGLNVNNVVPVGATSIQRLLGRGHGGVAYWAAQFLLALDQCMGRAADRNWCLRGASERLWSDRVRDPADGQVWMIDGLDVDGALRVRHGSHTARWLRWSSTGECVLESGAS